MTRIEDLEAREDRMREKIRELSPPNDASEPHWNDMTHAQRKRASRRKDVEANLAIVVAQLQIHYASLAAASHETVLTADHVAAVLRHGGATG